MKRIVYIIFLLSAGISFSGCKKYLNVDPPSDLSGNNFWKTRDDVENFTNGMYELLRKSVTREDMKAGAGNDEFPFFPFGGDLRGGMAKENTELGWGRQYIADLANNDIRRLLFSESGKYWSEQIFKLMRFTQWDRFYKVVAAANIAFDRIDGVPDPTLTDAKKKAYKAEAVFLRCITYFLLVRQFGDVPYYTNAYNSDPLPRTKMVEVLKGCVADMKAVKDDLPWTYDDPVFVSVRAMRGSAIALLMHINMWLASFDAGNATTYYEDVDKLGDEIQNQNGGAYVLLPLTRSSEIFKGRSKEGLFEVPQNANYGESFAWSTYYDLVKFSPTNPSASIPYISYDTKFMETLYPRGTSDQRAFRWFDPTTMYNANRTFKMSKFLVSTDPSAIDGFGFDASQIVFRYADIFLLQAEALAELGSQDQKARDKVNIVRNRAGAPLITQSGDDLKNEIFFERCRELLGEGHYWYDIVRTRRIINPEYKFGYHCTVDQYRAGAWTWPIDRSALTNNPNMTLNTYWQ